MNRKGNYLLTNFPFPFSSERKQRGSLDDLMEQRRLGSLRVVGEKHPEDIVFWGLFVIAASHVL